MLIFCKRINFLQTKLTNSQILLLKSSKMQKINSRPMQLRKIFQMKEPSFVLMTFLSLEELEMLRDAMFNNIKASEQYKGQILNCSSSRMLLSFIYHKQYVSKIDRSMFYFMYQDVKVKQEIDMNSILNVAQNFVPQINHLNQTFNKLFSQLQQYCDMQQPQLQAFKQMITVPDLPLPVSLRSNIGKFCNSPYQLFVCAKLTRSDFALQQQSQFQQWKCMLKDNQQNYMKSVLLGNGNNHGSSTMEKLRQLCFNPLNFVEKLNVNSQQEMIQGNHLYNFLTLTLKLTKTMISQIKLHLETVSSDPYTKFVQLLLRYSIFKSFVMQFQDQLGSIFGQFQELVFDLFNINTRNFKENNGVTFSACKILMTIFNKQMEEIIKQNVPVYINLAHKLKITEPNKLYIQTGLTEISNYLPKFDCYEGSPVLEYLLNENSLDNLQVFLTDFVQMCVDLSIDQNTVFWCGHSQQYLANTYQLFQEGLIEYQEAVFSRINNQSNLEGLQKTISRQLKFLEEKLNVKPRTLKNLIEQMNMESMNLYDFQAKDKQLNHVNVKLSPNYKPSSDLLYGSHKTTKSALTADSSDQDFSDIDFDDLQYVSEISVEDNYQQQVDI